MSVYIGGNMKTKITIIIILTLLLSSPCLADWSKRDKQWFINYSIINTIDYGLTYMILDDGGYEANPILKNINTDNIALFYVGSELLVLGLAHILPDTAKTNWFLIPLYSIKVAVVGHNAMVLMDIDY